MENTFKDKNSTNQYAWDEAMILDKIQKILNTDEIENLNLSEEELEVIKLQLKESLSIKDLTESAYIIAQSIDELEAFPDEDIKDYIIRLKKYLATSTVKCIKAEFKGVEFEVYENSDINDVFNNYYSKYDELYGISEMLSDLGLLK